jgi:hypothetical protein
VQEEIDTLMQVAHEPPLRIHRSLRSLEEVGTDATNDHGCPDDEELEHELGPEAMPIATEPTNGCRVTASPKTAVSMMAGMA